MSTLTDVRPRISGVSVSSNAITACLVDGRKVSVPLDWSWCLAGATPAQRKNFEIIGKGVGIHWPDIDEDLSIEGMLRGARVPRPKR